MRGFYIHFILRICIPPGYCKNLVQHYCLLWHDTMVNGGRRSPAWVSETSWWDMKKYEEDLNTMYPRNLCSHHEICQDLVKHNCLLWLDTKGDGGRRSPSSGGIIHKIYFTLTSQSSTTCQDLLKQNCLLWLDIMVDGGGCRSPARISEALDESVLIGKVLLYFLTHVEDRTVSTVSGKRT